MIRLLLLLFVVDDQIFRFKTINMSHYSAQKSPRLGWEHPQSCHWLSIATWAWFVFPSPPVGAIHLFNFSLSFFSFIGKPQPDIFLKAASLIDFTGKEGECLVFEVIFYFIFILFFVFCFYVYFFIFIFYFIFFYFIFFFQLNFTSPSGCPKWFKRGLYSRDACHCCS